MFKKVIAFWSINDIFRAISLLTATQTCPITQREDALADTPCCRKPIGITTFCTLTIKTDACCPWCRNQDSFRIDALQVETHISSASPIAKQEYSTLPGAQADIVLNAYIWKYSSPGVVKSVADEIVRKLQFSSDYLESVSDLDPALCAEFAASAKCTEFFDSLPNNVLPQIKDKLYSTLTQKLPTDSSLMIALILDRVEQESTTRLRTEFRPRFETPLRRHLTQLILKRLIQLKQV